jgi:hypothetical protein
MVKTNSVPDMDFHFKEETHEGYYRGYRVPSVSEIISPVGFDYTRINSEVLDRAISYGNHVHETIMLGMAGTLDLDTLDEPLKDVWYEFTGWFAKTCNIPGLPDERIVTKHRYYSKRLRYHGEPDIVLPGVLLELKTRRIDHHIDDLQCYAYEHLIGRPLQKILVELIPGQSLRAYPVKNKNAWGAFRKLLGYWWTNHETEEWIKKWKQQ